VGKKKLEWKRTKSTVSIGKTPTPTRGAEPLKTNVKRKRGSRQLQGGSRGSSSVNRWRGDNLREINSSLKYQKEDQDRSHDREATARASSGELKKNDTGPDSRNLPKVKRQADKAYGKGRPFGDQKRSEHFLEWGVDLEMIPEREVT